MSKKLLPHALILGSVAIAVLFCHVSSLRALTYLESALMQFVILGLGIAWSWTISAAAAEKGALDRIRPQARSAFRRIINLYRSLARIQASIDSAPQTYTIEREGQLALIALKGIVVEQLSTVGDAVEDWRDLLPEEFAQLEAKAASLPDHTQGEL